MSELRKDPVLDRWVIIATERGRRPSDLPSAGSEPRPATCPFCGGNEHMTPPEIYAARGNTPANGPGWEVRVVANKFPALNIEGTVERSGIGLLDRMTGVGAHEVIIETPTHEEDMAEASLEHTATVIKTFQQRTLDLRRDDRFRHIIIFRNHRAEAGASLSHPHSQLIALPIVPQIVKATLQPARLHYMRKERCIFCDLIEQELALPDRVVRVTDQFVVLSPFAAGFPFELTIYPLRHSHDFVQMDDKEMLALAEVIKDVLQRYKTVLNDPPYNMMLQTAPTTLPRPGHPEYWGTIAYDFHWSIQIIPRLTKQAGFEWGTGFFINPVSPELAAESLQVTSS